MVAAASSEPATTAAAAPTWPAWLRRSAPSEPERPVATTPSEVDEMTPREWGASTGEARQKALKRGLLIHRLMQSLPDIAPQRRAEAAARHVGRAGHAFAPAEQDAFVATTLRLLAEPRFAALFSPGSRAEIPVVGRLARPGKSPLLVSGQIDRLAVTAAEVLIGDYKTNRPAPRAVAEVPPAYIRQLALYRAMLARLYPDRPVRAVLIWTDVPDLMELSAETLDAEIDRLTSA
jgi:ATP-dependent helicase/nuclease subunit A